MSAVADLQAYLEDQGLIGGSSGWPFTRRVLHDGSDQLVILTEDGGGRPEIHADTGIGDMACQDPAVQVRVRGEPHDHDTAHDKAEEILRAVHGLRGAMLGSTEYVRVASQTSEPIYIGQDAKRRPEFTLSFRMMSLVPA